MKSVLSVVKQEIVWRVEGLFGLADQLEERLAKARGQVAAKFDTSSGLRPPSPRSRRRRVSLLARAFAGQLVPKNPTDEPAEKLLERIKTSQTKPRERKRPCHNKQDRELP